MTNKALVIGVTGGFGKAMAEALLRDGWEVSALMRGKRQLPASFGIIETVTGDARNREEVIDAARDVDVIVQGFNVPYPRWDKDWPRANRAAMDAAANSGATILFPGNIYNFGMDAGETLSELSPQNPDTHKGHLRKRLEVELAADAVARAYRVIILRASDYFGPSQLGGWFGDALVNKLENGVITYPANLGSGHSWAYLPDLADAGLRLLHERASLTPFEIFHFRGHASITGDEMVAAIRKGSGMMDARVKHLPWLLLRVLGLGMPMMREIHEMRWLWQHPHVLVDDKLRCIAPDLVSTPLDQAVADTLEAHGKLAAERKTGSGYALA